MPAETHIKPDLAVQLEKAEWWQEPPVLLRERLHAGDVAEIHLLRETRQDGQDAQDDGADEHR